MVSQKSLTFMKKDATKFGFFGTSIILRLYLRSTYVLNFVFKNSFPLVFAEGQFHLIILA